MEFNIITKKFIKWGCDEYIEARENYLANIADRFDCNNNDVKLKKMHKKINTTRDERGYATELSLLRIYNRERFRREIDTIKSMRDALVDKKNKIAKVILSKYVYFDDFTKFMSYATNYKLNEPLILEHKAINRQARLIRKDLERLYYYELRDKIFDKAFN